MNIMMPYLNNKNDDPSHIPMTRPSITKKEISYVNDAMKNGWGSNRNNYIFVSKYLFKVINDVFRNINYWCFNFCRSYSLRYTKN